MKTATAAPPRRGIAAAGNWIVDRVKTVPHLPGPGMLASITREVRSPGGAPANVLADLARLGAPFPLAGYGVVGDDAEGRFLRETYAALGVEVRGLVTHPRAPTSYTDVMSAADTGERTFFHHRGANAEFGPEHVPVAALGCRIFHLGYLLLLDRLDAPDAEFGSVAGRLLASVRAQGIRTSVDVVSEDGDRFRQLVPLALPYTDYLVVNEIEAGRTAGLTVRRADGTLDAAALQAAAAALLKLGRLELVAIHFPEGALLRRRDGTGAAVGSLALPPDFVKSSVGAGDAFCAGLLYGLHEGWADAEALRLGCCAAAASLSAPGATDGVGPLAEVQRLAQRHPARPAPVTP